MTRAARVAALTSALLASLLPHGAHAQTPAPSSSVATSAIELVSQDPWTPVGGDLRIGVRVSRRHAGTPDARLRFAASAPLTSRSDFDRVLAEGVRGSPIDQVEIPLAPLTADANGNRSLTIGLESARLDPGRLALRRPGVYPVVVELLGEGTEDADGTSFTTFAVVTESTSDGQPRPLTRRLGVAWVWPLHEGPSVLPNGSRDPAVLESFTPDGRLGRQAAALTRAGDVRLTLVPGPETLAAWVARGRDDAASAQGAAAVLDAAGRSEVVSTTYVPTDIPSLLRGNLQRVVDRQLVHGREVLTAQLGAAPVTTTVLARPANDASLAHLRAGAVERVIVDSASLVPGDDGAATITRPFEIRPTDDSGNALGAVASDSGLVALLAGKEPAPLRAQRVLAGLSVVALEAPSEARAVVLASQSELTAPTALFDTLLAGLRGNPLLESMTVADVFERVPAAASRDSQVRSLVPAAVPDPPIPAPVYRITEARLDAFTVVVGPEDPVVTESAQAMLIAESSTFVGADGRARAVATIDRVNATVDGFLAAIQVPDPGTITLTSRAGEIPLTFRNGTGRKVRVTVAIVSPKLFFPEGAVRTIELAPESTTLRLAVEARTSGTFPLRLSVQTAEGGLVIAETRFQVRSTVVSAVGLLLMIGAAVFLALWWGLYVLRARRRRRDEVPPGG